MKFRPYAILVSLMITTCMLIASVASDGFPTGQSTAEGAAADLARAFIKRDFGLFEKICLPVYGAKEVRAAYEEFRAEVKKSMQEEAQKKEPSPGGPKTIGKVFAARRLSLDGPASYGYAVFGFEDVQFVDVGVLLVNGDRSLNRTLVVKKSGKWFVHPLPSISPLLCAGLNDEQDSVADWRKEDEANQPSPPTATTVIPPAEPSQRADSNISNKP
jgi:hypothetical protein